MTALLVTAAAGAGCGPERGAGPADATATATDGSDARESAADTGPGETGIPDSATDPPDTLDTCARGGDTGASSERAAEDIPDRIVGPGDGGAPREIRLVPDFDGDGVPEVSTGGSGTDGQGAVYFVSGPVRCSDSLADADTTLIGEGHGDNADDDWDSADFDGDGQDDILVGAAGANRFGEAYVVFGPVAGERSLGSADVELFGESGAGDTAVGSLVEALGDVNGDGFADLVVDDPLWGCVADKGCEGRGYLLPGPLDAGSRWVGEGAGVVSSTHGYSARYGALGDSDGDGLHDFTAYSPAGRAVVLGRSDLLAGLDLERDPDTFIVSSDEAVTGVPEGWSDYAPAGDINGDGYADLFLGASGSDLGGTDAGGGCLILGPLPTGDVDRSIAEAALIGFVEGEDAGVHFSAAGDVDADGYDDLLIGNSASDSGSAYLVKGPVSGTVSLVNADLRVTTDDANGVVGYYVAGGQDLDGDGFDDIAVSDNDATCGGTCDGVIYILYGATL